MPLSAWLSAPAALAAANLGGRDQTLLSQMGAAQGRRPAVLVMALVAAVVSCGLALCTSLVLTGFASNGAKTLVAALAAAAAGLAMLRPSRSKAPAEPTASLFAAWLVFTVLQFAGPAPWLIVAVGLRTGQPLWTGCLGLGASMAGLVLVWRRPDLPRLQAVRFTRRLLGVLVLGLGLALIGLPLIGTAPGHPEI